MDIYFSVWGGFRYHPDDSGQIFRSGDDPARDINVVLVKCFTMIAIPPMISR